MAGEHVRILATIHVEYVKSPDWWNTYRRMTLEEYLDFTIAYF